MSSNGDCPGGGATTAATLVDQSNRHSWPAGHGAPAAGGGRPDDPTADRSRATASLRRVEKEFDELWRAAVVAGERAWAEQLVDVSHALRRAAALMGNTPGIG
jgi:hypothetical protein